MSQCESGYSWMEHRVLTNTLQQSKMAMDNRLFCSLIPRYYRYTHTYIHSIIIYIYIIYSTPLYKHSCHSYGHYQRVPNYVPEDGDGQFGKASGDLADVMTWFGGACRTHDIIWACGFLYTFIYVYIYTYTPSNSLRS